MFAHVVTLLQVHVIGNMSNRWEWEVDFPGLYVIGRTTRTCLLCSYQAETSLGVPSALLVCLDDQTA